MTIICSIYKTVNGWKYETNFPKSFAWVRPLALEVLNEVLNRTTVHRLWFLNIFAFVEHVKSFQLDFDVCIWENVVVWVRSNNYSHSPKHTHTHTNVSLSLSAAAAGAHIHSLDEWFNVCVTGFSTHSPIQYVQKRLFTIYGHEVCCMWYSIVSIEKFLYALLRLRSRQYKPFRTALYCFLLCSDDSEVTVAIIIPYMTISSRISFTHVVSSSSFCFNAMQLVVCLHVARSSHHTFNVLSATNHIQLYLEGNSLDICNYIVETIDNQSTHHFNVESFLSDSIWIYFVPHTAADMTLDVWWYNAMHEDGLFLQYFRFVSVPMSVFFRRINLRIISRISNGALCHIPTCL